MRVLVVALALGAVSIAGCGDSGRSQHAGGNGRTAGQGHGKGHSHRRTEDFALAREVCGERPKADFAVESAGVPADASDAAIARGYAAQWSPKDRKAAFAGCMDGLAGAPARFPSSSHLARSIWGRNFVATSVVAKKGQAPPFVKPLHIRFWFSDESRHAVSWEARCNSYGADARFTARRIQVDVTLMTMVGCFPGRGREDNWLSSFMEANPKWSLEGEHMRLTTDGATIELKRFQAPEKCPLSPSGGWVDLDNSGIACEEALTLVGLYEEGKIGHRSGWKCRNGEPRDGQAVLLCRHGGKRFAVEGIAPGYFEQ